MSVKFKGTFSKPRTLNGGGVKGGTLGILENLSQSNDSANCVDRQNRFKFIDDLSTLEIINVLTIGIASHNFRYQVANDIPVHGQIIPRQNLNSQKYLIPRNHK